jgi:hypothetical protein
MGFWDEKTPVDIMADIDAVLAGLHNGPQAAPDAIWMPFATWYALKRLYVRDWLATRKRNKRRPAFATAWRN